MDVFKIFSLDIFSSSSVEQIADIPVLHHGFFGSFQGFHPGQSTAASSEQIADIPVPHHGFFGSFQGFHPGQSTAASSEQIADIPVPHYGFFGGFQGFHPGQSTAASSEQIVDIPVPHGGPPSPRSSSRIASSRCCWRSVKIGPHTWSELLPESSPATRAAHFDQFWEGESGGTWMLLHSGRWYLLCSDPEVFWGGLG